jgi:hypothetical protein
MTDDIITAAYGRRIIAAKGRTRNDVLLDLHARVWAAYTQQSRRGR